jgi:Flp pilus assembly protein TadD
LNKGGINGKERLQEARKSCDGLLRENPCDPNLLCQMGFIDFQLGQMDEADAWMQKAMTLAPESSELAYNYGIMLMARKRFAAALPLMRRVVALKPDHAKAYYFIGTALEKAGDLRGALTAFNKSLKINPQDTDVLNDTGTILKDMGHPVEAAACYERAMVLKPDNPPALNNLANVRLMQNDLDGAEALHRKALAIQPEFPEALVNLSTILRLKGDFEGAIFNCQKALALRPDSPEALNNLGNALKDAGRIEEAVATFRAALRLRPDDPVFHLNLSVALLALGRFAEGWREYEWRWKNKHINNPFHFAQPAWQGEDGEGRTLLVTGEQGFGDMLQFCRYAPLAKERGFRVVMCVPPALKRLMQSLDGVEKIISYGEVLPRFDFYCPMMSLPLVFQTTVETIPAGLPYLCPDPDDLAGWRDRVAAAADGAFKVGLFWAGSPRNNSLPELIVGNLQRSIAPEVLAPLMDVPGVRYFSLQKTSARAPDAFHVIDWMADCRDFADTAALIMNMDLLIGIDTAVAHLAGALGKPVWVLHQFNSDWRYFIDRDDSPWYPGALRLFRQKKMGDWDEVVIRVRDALAAKVFQAAALSPKSSRSVI